MSQMVGVLFLMFLSFISCQKKEQKHIQESNIQFIKNVEISNTKKEYWISELYLQCIKEKLPCECISQVEFSLLAYTRKSSGIYIYEYQSGFEELDVRYLEGNEYEVYISFDSPSPFFKMEIFKDTLYLTKDDVRFRYVNYPQLYGSEENDLVGQLNMKMISDKLINLKGEINQKLRITDSTSFYCNKELGGVNLLSTKNDCDNMWILEDTDEGILIYDYLNSCDSKAYPVELRKKMMYRISK